MFQLSEIEMLFVGLRVCGMEIVNFIKYPIIVDSFFLHFFSFLSFFHFIHFYVFKEICFHYYFLLLLWIVRLTRLLKRENMKIRRLNEVKDDDSNNNNTPRHKQHNLLISQMFIFINALISLHNSFSFAIKKENRERENKTKNYGINDS